MSDADKHGDSPATKAFASRLAKYAYADQTTSPSRGSSRWSASGLSSGSGRHPVTAVNDDVVNERQPPGAVISEETTAATLSRRKASEETTESSPSGKKSKKLPRPYAGPEVYAHLSNTPDHLSQGLDIIFCGINPGKKSAESGTHFAHPTNKFWRALHLSGLTPRLYAPSECHLLPAELNYGLTNLCGRPTAEQSELSTLEMRLNVHPFTLKLIRLRPRVVCFVGKKIWDVFEAVAGKGSKLSAPAPPHSVETEHTPETAASSPLANIDTDVKLEISEGPSTLLRHAVERASTTPRFAESSMKVTRTKLSSPRGKATAEFDWHAPRSLRLVLPPNGDQPEGGHCYFWATPSTSGLERTPLAEQANIFAGLRLFSASLKEKGDPPPEGYRDIDTEILANTSSKIRADAIAKGTIIYPSVHA